MKDQYKRKAEWILTDKCNYACSYCCIGKGEHSPENVVSDTLEFLGSRFKANYVSICGGEPSIHPALSRVSEYFGTHGVAFGFDTNLSRKAEYFVDVVERSSRMLKEIHATFHPEYSKFDEFCDKIIKIRSLGHCEIDVRHVACFDNFEQAKQIQSRFEAAGIAAKPKIEKLRRRDRSNPALRTGRTAPYDQTYSEWLSQWTAADLIPKYYPVYKGKLCWSGVDYVHIEIDGSVFRCASACVPGGRMGVVTDTADFLPKGPRPCVYGMCKCRESDRHSLLDEHQLAKAIECSANS